LFFELLGDIARAGTGDFDPSLGEGGTSKKHVSDEYSGMNWIEKSVCDVEWWRPVRASEK